MSSKAILLDTETEGCVAQSYPSGKHELTLKHNVLYDYIYNDENEFFIIVDDRLYPETSTAFGFTDPEVTAEICEKIYESTGVSGVTDYANKIGLPWEFCFPCEAEMPMIQYQDHKECDCCGTINVK